MPRKLTSLSTVTCLRYESSMVGSYSSTKWFWTNMMVSADFPTPPEPTTTILSSSPHPAISDNACVLSFGIAVIAAEMGAPEKLGVLGCVPMGAMGEPNACCWNWRCGCAGLEPNEELCDCEYEFLPKRLCCWAGS